MASARSSVDPRTPVVVGVAQRTQKPDNLAEALEAVAFMEAAVVDAAADAGAPGLLNHLDVIAVVAGAWKYSDPARIIAGNVGSPDAATVLSSNGGNSPQSLVNHVCARIAAGELNSAVVVGAETIWSRRRARRSGIDQSVTEQLDVEPDERFGEDVQMSTEFEKERGFAMPVNLYPIFESAIRASNGEDHAAHRARLGELWAGFNKVASNNPHAWMKSPMSDDEIVTASPTNRMVGYPYTKAMNSNWDLDQSAALLICSAEQAEAAGVSRDRWVFPHAGTDAHDTYAVTERRDLHSSPAITAAARRLFEMTDATPDDVDHIDLYSCFPSAVQISAAAIGLDLDRQLTQTGGLTFAGGPLNNYVSHSIAAMVDTLRSDAGSLGLVTANGGFVTKHAMALYSTEPASHPFLAEDVQQLVDQSETVAPDTGYDGPVTIEGYTVMHDKDGPEQLMAAVRTPNGRTWGTTNDATVMETGMQTELIGQPAELSPEGVLTI